MLNNALIMRSLKTKRFILEVSIHTSLEKVLDMADAEYEIRHQLGKGMADILFLRLRNGKTNF